MEGEWETAELGEVATVRSGYAFKSRDWTESGIPVVKIANVKGGRLEMSGCSHVAAATAADASEFQLRVGDILIAMTGYVGDVARVRSTDLPCVLNQRVGRFSILDPVRLDDDYLFCFLSWSETRKVIEGLGYGSAQPNVSPSLIRRVEIPIPPLPEQRAIAHTLGTLHDKIELNRRFLDSLRQLARAIAVAAFVGSDRRPLGSIATLQRGFGYRSEGFGPSGTPMISMGSTERRGWLKRSGVRSYVEPVRRQYFVGPWDLLAVNVDLTWKLDVLGWPLIVPRDLRSAVISNDVFALRFYDPARWLRVVTWAYLQTWEARSIIEGVAKGTTVASIAGADLLSLEIPVPTDTTQIARLEQAADLIERGWLAELESGTLTELRDTLLPKLISGETRVQHVQSAVASAPA